MVLDNSSLAFSQFKKGWDGRQKHVLGVAHLFVALEKNVFEILLPQFKTIA